MGRDKDVTKQPGDDGILFHSKINLRPIKYDMENYHWKFIYRCQCLIALTNALILDKSCSPFVSTPLLTSTATILFLY